MPSTAIWCGRLLILVGIIGYIYGMMNNNPSMTALIPAAFGVVLMLLGHLSNSMENMRKHLMHVAVLIGLIGFIIPLTRIISSFGTFSVTTIFLLSMSLICLYFVVICLKSFIAARQNG